MSLNECKLKNNENLAFFLNEAKSIKTNNFDKKINVGILASFSLNGLEETLRVKSAQKGIDCRIYVGDYNQYNQEIFKSDSKLFQFNPQLTFLILDIRHILGELYFLPYSISASERKEFVETKVDEIKKLVETFLDNSNSKLVITSFQIPVYSPYGINEQKEDFGMKQLVYEINNKIRHELKDQSLVFIYDFNEFVMKFGEYNVFNYQDYFFRDIKISIDYIPKFADELLGYVNAVMGITKKCIVLDLDNTLWGGIIGEDGFDNIKLGDDPIGRSFVEFQKRLLALNQRGIILAINSKNNFDDAIEVIRKHPNMILREDNFACMKINWNDKVVNLQEISQELNIGLDSFVFFDDDQINQEYVRSSLQDVLVVDLPKDSSQFSQIVTEMKEFDVVKITEEDVKRNDMYLGQKKRKELENEISDFKEFLKQMNIEVNIQNADSFSIPRISQLTLKTNQFNLTTRRYQEEEISAFASSKDRIVECAQVSDKFGDNGITGVYIVKKESNEEWIIDTFLLSCRIIGRGVEETMLSQIIEKAKSLGVKRIKGEFISTSKNKPAENFYNSYGFKKIGDYWIFDTNQKIETPDHIKLRRNDE